MSLHLFYFSTSLMQHCWAGLDSAAVVATHPGTLDSACPLTCLHVFDACCRCSSVSSIPLIPSSIRSFTMVKVRHEPVLPTPMFSIRPNIIIQSTRTIYLQRSRPRRAYTCMIVSPCRWMGASDFSSSCMPTAPLVICSSYIVLYYSLCMWAWTLTLDCAVPPLLLPPLLLLPLHDHRHSRSSCCSRHQQPLLQVRDRFCLNNCMTRRREYDSTSDLQAAVLGVTR